MPVAHGTVLQHHWRKFKSCTKKKSKQGHSTIKTTFESLCLWSHIKMRLRTCTNSSAYPWHFLWHLCHVRDLSPVSDAWRHVWEATVGMPETVTWHFWPSVPWERRLWMFNAALMHFPSTTTTAALSWFETSNSKWLVNISPMLWVLFDVTFPLTEILKYLFYDCLYTKSLGRIE